MSETERESKPGFWRRLGRRLSDAADLMWLIEGLVAIVRLVMIPFRLLGRVLSDL